MKDKHVNPDNARPGVYAEVIGEIEKNKICPFCEKHLSEIHPNPLEEWKYWIVTNNAYPYVPKKEHVLLIHKEHVEDVSELSSNAWNELKEIIDSEKKRRGISGGSFIMRFGETKFTGASVTHLHAHLFQSDPDSEKYDKKTGVLTRIG